ncbi:hypothetical protein GBA63_10595 [Rubrobacter tropicus]|uniref:Uncharacterized protein n=1 Tax=Rubrobacter tropicus TaxID=2653851 RepID=A0A6G8Q993_9ACTN|nr:hypothetical protein [Rubrobacter tropicus]QIN83050.1 hypothetical protein GBA63_10595 [Rubrobacter tropicus]
MFRRIRERTNWRAVVVGWAVAIAAGIALNLVFEAAHVFLFGGEALSAASPTTGVVAISLVSGFLAHFAGGYVAGRKARVSGGLHGAMVAILGFVFVVVAVAVVSAILLATAGIVLVEGGIPLPSVTLGFAGGALLASLALLVLNLIGGFFGGALGEWERGPVGTSGGATRTPAE